MATIRERLVYAIELVTDKAQAGVKGFRQSVAEAEGGVNKFRAGASSAMATVAANAGTLALAGGAALTTFAAKAVGAFQETALEAGKLADATGLTVEAASRLREVASDIGVSGETVTGIITRMNRAIGSGAPAIEQYGIALQKTDDGAADVNATLIETIRRIGAIQNPTERAAAAQAIFGRSYAEAAELIFANADKLQQKLAEVSDAKVVTPEELARAREFRDTMEDLKDAGEDLAVTSGEVLVPVLGDVAEVLAAIADAAEIAKRKIQDIPGGGDFLDKAFSGIPDIADEALSHLRDLEEGLGFTVPDESIGELRQQFNQMIADSNAAKDAVVELGDEVVELGPRWSAANIPLEAASGNFATLSSEADRAADAVRDSGDAADEAADHFNVFQEGLQKSADQVSFLTSELNKLDEDLRTVELLADIQEQFDKIAEGTDDIQDQQREVFRLTELVSDYVGTLKNIPTEQVTRIIAALRSGDVEQIRALMDDLTKDRFINISLSAKTIAGFDSLNAQFAAGRIPTAPTFTPTQSAIPASSVDSRTIINNFPIGTTTTSVYLDQQLDQRRNGPY